MAIPISNVTRRVVYAASGTGPYAFTFEILANTDIAVYRDDTLLTLTTNYTVTINANGTGSITLTAEPTGATQIAIVGNRTIQRTTDFVTGGDFFANTVNDEMDQQTIFAQQNAEGLSRALIAPQTDPTTIDMTLPRASVRANKTLAFDANGDPTTGEVIGDNRGNWASGVAYNKRDIVKDTSNSNIYYCNTSHTSSGSQPISSNADSAKWDLFVDAVTATDAQAAAEAAQAAAEAAQAAAETAETNAETAETNAETAATNAASSASAASTSASNASSSASSASSSASAASASASTASTQASNASTSASNASTSASSASTSASNASTSASSASTSASNASTSATNAANSASSATSSASSAASAQASAEAARDATLTAYDSFDDRYLGAKSSNPSVDNDGDALVAGALYYNTTVPEMRLYTGSAWVAAYVSGASYLLTSNNLSELTASAATVRTNLGLAIGTDVQAYDADTAKTDVVQSFTVAQRGAVSALTDGATITPDFAVANNFSVTLGGNRTLANPTNLTAGQSGAIVITQDGTGSRTLAYGSYFKFPQGTAPTLTTTASAVDVLAYYVESSTRITARLMADVK